MHKFLKLLTRILPYLLIASVITVIFYKTLLHGLIPFPGDLMLSSYAPWRHTSYFGYVAGAIPSKDQYFDTVRELYPWKTLVVDAFKHMQIPLWNPYNFSGTPLLANHQSQSFYPLSFLYLMLPQITAWTILIILQPLLGSLFVYLFASEIGLSASAAVITALLFNFSSFSNSWMEFNTVWHTILWLPLLLYIVERGIKTKHISRGGKFIFIFALFSSITGGHPQDFIYTFSFFVIYVAARLKTLSIWSSKEKFGFVLNHVLGIVTVPFFLAAPQILPTIELFAYSSRVPHDFQHVVTTMLVQWWQLPMLFVQDFFGNPATKSYYALDTYVGKTLSIGSAGFVLALIGLFQKNGTWHRSFFLGTAGVILLLTVNTPFAQLFYRLPIPILSTGTPTRVLFLLAFAFATLAGFGFDYAKSLSWKKFIFPIIAIATILTLLWLISATHPTVASITISMLTSKRALIVATSITLCVIFLFLLKSIRHIFIYGIIIVIAGELFYSVMKFNPFVPASFIYPPNDVITFLQTHAGINRFWGYGTARMESNVNAQYKLFSADGTDPLNLSWYNRFIQASNDGNIAQQFTRSTRSDVAIAPGYGPEDLPSNPHRLRIMDLLGVQFVLDRLDNPKDNYTFTADRFKSVFTTADGYTIYENIKALPRVFLADEYKTYTSDKEFEHMFFDPSVDLKKTIFLSSSSPLPVGKLEQAKKRDVYITSYTSNEVRLTTDADASQLLFLSDTYAPGWFATIDEIPTPVLRANYAFRAIQVPSGTHTVRFYYYPQSFQFGIYTAVVGVLLSIGVLSGFPWLLKRKRA